MPLVALDLQDLYILVTEYKKKDSKLSAERRRLTLLNERLEKIISETGKIL